MSGRESVPDDVFRQIQMEMTEAELNGTLSGMFNGECRSRANPLNRQSFTQSIRMDMKLYKSTFMKMFAYDMTAPGFAEDIIARLNILGCEKAREYYIGVVSEWQHEHDKAMRNAAAWYRKQDFSRKKGDDQLRNQQEVEQLKSLTVNELKELCRRLLKEGVIETPEQFVEEMLRNQ